MPYSQDNPPALVSQRVGSNGGAKWNYTSADALATVIAAGYVDNAADLGMKVGDTVEIVDTGNTLVDIAHVTAISAAGASTMVQVS